MNTPDPLADALAVALYSEVRAAGWSLTKLGEALEPPLSAQTLQRYLTRRERDLPVRVLTQVPRIIGVPLEDIVAAARARVAREHPTAPPETRRKA